MEKTDQIQKCPKCGIDRGAIEYVCRKCGYEYDTFSTGIQGFAAPVAVEPPSTWDRFTAWVTEFPNWLIAIVAVVAVIALLYYLFN